MEPVTTARDRKRLARREEAEERNRRYRLRQAAQERLAPLEMEIARLEKRNGELTAQQADPERSSSTAPLMK